MHKEAIPTLEQVKNIFSDTYKFYLSCHAMSDTEENWSKALQESNRINEKHNSKLCKEIIVAIIEQVDKEKKEKKNENNKSNL